MDDGFPLSLFPLMHLLRVLLHILLHTITSLNNHIFCQRAASLNILDMDLAKTLIRSVVRAFYDTPFILVIDALMVHSAFVRAHPTLSDWS